MKKIKNRLEKKGWEVGDAKDFLNLSEEEIKLIEIRIALGKFLKNKREKSGYTQVQFARKIRSSQSRIAKMENGDNSVSIDLLVKSLLSLQTSTKEISRTIAGI